MRDRIKSLGTRGRVGLTVIAILVTSGGYYAYWSIALDRFTTFTKHQLYQSRKMDPEDLLRVTEDYGIRSVIDLRTFAEDAAGIEAERRALADTDVTYLHLPTGQVPDAETVLKFLNFVGNPANRPALVHCAHGTGRAVLFGSLYRIEFENWDNEAARRAVEPLHWRGNFGPNSDKGKYLLAYERHNITVVVAANE